MGSDPGGYEITPLAKALNVFSSLYTVGTWRSVMSSVAVLPREEAEAVPSFEPAFDDVDGLLVEKKMGTKSGNLGGQVYLELGGFSKRNRLGFVHPPDVAYQFAGLAKGRPRFADVSFVARDRYPDNELPDGWTDFPPDLVVEVVSPHDNANSVDIKVQEWLASGVRLVWIIYPRTRSVVVRRANGTMEYIATSGALSGEDVVPGFTLAVADIFAAF